MLKYLFTVVYKDRSRYVQNAEDVSVKDPTKSCFFDVDLPNVVLFTLRDHRGTHFDVDLSTGLFRANSPQWISIHDEKEVKPGKTVVYFRRVNKDFGADGALLDEKVVYHIGWKGVTLEGKPVEYTVAIV